MGLYTQSQRRRQQQVCYLALFSSRWSVLAPASCDTITDITTGITRRRQESSIEPGLDTSLGGIKPVFIRAGCTDLFGLFGSSG